MHAIQHLLRTLFDGRAPHALADLSTRKALLASVLDALLKVHVDAVIEKGFSALMDQPRLDDLKTMYGLCALVDALPQLRTAFAAYIKRVVLFGAPRPPGSDSARSLTRRG